MTTPAPVLTITPASVNRTAADLTPTVNLADTATHTPVATGRSFRFDAVAVKATVGATGAGISSAVPYPVNLAAGTRQGSVATTNTDGTGTSANVALTVTDAVATQYATPVYVENSGKIVRFLPEQLPNEYRDPTLSTPGLPTATGVYNARTRGVI
jgi:hypothetical protein